MLTELIDVLDRLKQGPSRSTPRKDHSDMSDDGRCKILSKKNFPKEEKHRGSELGKFFVTGPTVAVEKPSQSCCRVCRKDVLVLTNGHHELLRRFQGFQHFDRD